MGNRYSGPSAENRAGCIAAVIATPAMFFTLFTNFMLDFIMPEGSFILKVLLPALAAGGAIFLGMKTIFHLIRRKQR